MEFNELASAMNGDEELQVGQIYFALPLSWLARPLQAEEMASLAVKASTALARSGRERCGCRRKMAEMVVYNNKKTSNSRRAAVTRGGGDHGGDGGRRRSFTKLTSVPEE